MENKIKKYKFDPVKLQCTPRIHWSDFVFCGFGKRKDYYKLFGIVEKQVAEIAVDYKVAFEFSNSGVATIQFDKHRILPRTGGTKAYQGGSLQSLSDSVIFRDSVANLSIGYEIGPSFGRTKHKAFLRWRFLTPKKVATKTIVDLSVKQANDYFNAAICAGCLAGIYGACDYLEELYASQ